MTAPNIIFIECDSMDGRAMGCMDHPAMTEATPNLDALASRGTLFRQTYTNNPVCCPSRASMFSGLYTHHCEGWNNYKGLESDDATFMMRLANNGYRIQTYGKTDYRSGHHTIRARVSPWTRSAFIPRAEYRMKGPEILKEDRRRVHTHDWENVDRTLGWLHQEACADSEPFFLYLGLNAPHPAFTTTPTWLAQVNDKAVTLPSADQSYHPALAYQRFHKNWLHGLDEATVRDVRRIYFAMVAETDAMVGAVMQAVDDLALADNTHIIFLSDHGELAMEHEQFYKMSMFEGSIRVPLIVAGPDIQRDACTDALVSLVDIYPTVMDMTETPHPDGLDGQTLMPLLTGNTDSADRTTVLSEFHGSTLPTGTFMLRRGPWKYVAYVGYPPQLFNLDEDPDEIHDLSAERPDITASMDEALRDVVDYEAVDAHVKDYDRESFAAWRAAGKAAGTYDELMARVYSGWDDLAPDGIEPWRPRDEALIEAWLRE